MLPSNFRIFLSFQKEMCPLSVTLFSSSLPSVLYMESYNTWCFGTDFFHLARCLQGSAGCNMGQDFIPLLSDSFPLCGYVIWICVHMLYVLSSVDEYVGHFQFFCYYEKCCYKFVYQPLCEHRVSFLVGRYLGVELLVLTATLCLTFWETSKLFSKVAAQFTFPPMIDKDSFLCILTNNCYCLAFLP